MAGDIDYRATPIPSEKRPPEYSYAERRAEILQLWEQAGHPYALDQGDLAQRYDTSQQNISNDYQVLFAYLADHADEDRIDAITETVFHNAMRDLAEDDPYKAAKTAKMYLDVMFSRGKLDREPDRVDHDVSLSPDEAYIDDLRQNGD